MLIMIIMIMVNMKKYIIDNTDDVSKKGTSDDNNYVYNITDNYICNNQNCSNDGSSNWNNRIITILVIIQEVIWIIVITSNMLYNVNRIILIIFIIL